MTRRQILAMIGTASAVAGLVLTGPTSGVARTAEPPEGHVSSDSEIARSVSQSLLAQVPTGTDPRADKIKEPTGTNPYLGLLTDPGKVDWPSWRAAMARAGKERAARSRIAEAPVTPVLVDEEEPADTLGGNDRIGTAQEVPRFGTGDKVPTARVLGTLAPGPMATPVPAGTEDDGSIPTATDTKLTASQVRISTTGKIGDGPHGSKGDKKGDFDFYKVAARAGQRLLVDIDTPPPTATDLLRLDSVVVVWDSHGEAVAVNDDDAVTLDSRLIYTVPTAGDYYVSVGSYESAYPEDRFNSGSGPGVATEGDYTITMGLDSDDVDYYRIDLRAGDVLGASVSGKATELSVRDPEGKLRIASGLDQSAIYPNSSPLPGGGAAVLAHVANRTGPHTIAVAGGEGGYDLTLQVYRPGAEKGPASSAQTVFLDFDGAQVNTRIWGGAGVRTLSPFRAFLGRFGLRADQEDAAIDAIVRTVKENVAQDFGDSASVRIIDSRDSDDPFGQPSVSRVIIGGSTTEAGLDTIGISQSIDPGNFDQEESALVLLDGVSAVDTTKSGTNPAFAAYLDADSDRVRFIGQAIGNAVSHEIGHFLGNWHTAALDPVHELMDQGGNFPMLWGVGKDGIGGTADDVDVDFGSDRYSPGEGFDGTEDTAANTRWGLSPRR